MYFGNKALRKFLDKVAVYHSYETGQAVSKEQEGVRADRPGKS